MPRSPSEAAAPATRSDVVPSRAPAREARSSSFPAFDTDWDVPAFQRRGGQ